MKVGELFSEKDNKKTHRFALLKNIVSKMEKIILIRIDVAIGA